MDYRKPALTFEEQLQQLMDRGLSVRDGTDFTDVIALYDFDRRLRLLMLDAIERIEVSVRTALTYEIGHAFGSFGHIDANNFTSSFRHADFMAELAKEERRAKETFALHFRSKYTSEPHLPIWMATELISLGTLSQLYAHVSPTMHRSVCSRYGVPEPVFGNWRHVLSYVRNVCAHHKRLWNRELAIRPMIPHRHPVWASLAVDNRRLAAALAISMHLMKRSAPASAWTERVCKLFEDCAFVPLASGGGARPIALLRNW